MLVRRTADPLRCGRGWAVAPVPPCPCRGTASAASVRRLLAVPRQEHVRP